MNTTDLISIAKNTSPKDVAVVIKDSYNKEISRINKEVEERKVTNAFLEREYTI